jgi:hypothetical protein
MHGLWTSIRMDILGVLDGETEKLTLPAASISIPPGLILLFPRRYALYIRETTIRCDCRDAGLAALYHSWSARASSTQVSTKPRYATRVCSLNGADTEKGRNRRVRIACPSVRERGVCGSGQSALRIQVHVEPLILRDILVRRTR